MRQHARRDPTGVSVDALHVQGNRESEETGDAVQLSSKRRLAPAELTTWPGLSATTREGPWCEPRQFASQVTVAASYASSN